jgi:hypothetical protein
MNPYNFNLKLSLARLSDVSDFASSCFVTELSMTFSLQTLQQDVKFMLSTLILLFYQQQPEFLVLLFFSAFRPSVMPPVGLDTFPQHFVPVSFVYPQSLPDVGRLSVKQCTRTDQETFQNSSIFIIVKLIF